MTEKKPKKKSLTAVIKKLREDLKEQRDHYESAWREIRKLRRQVEDFERICPLKYYLIKFKIHSNSKIMQEYTEIVSSYSPTLAIIKVRLNKTYPETFELLDIKLRT